jgi:hypothetical protein
VFRRLLPDKAAALLVSIAIVGALVMLAQAAYSAECPNKFGDQKEVSAGADTDAEAKTKLAEVLKTALEEAAADCKDKTCTEPRAKCRFVHTVTKVNCKDAPNVPGGPKRMCSQKYRPGCFCLKEDETIELRALRPGRTEK